MAAATVATPCAAYNAMAREWDIIDALMGGTRTMRERSTAFLPQETDETDAQYRIRLSRSFLKPSLREAIQSGRGEVFRYEVDTSGVVPRLASLLDDVDLQGNDLTSFLAAAFGDMLTYGHCHLLAAYPTMNPNATQADAALAGARPYGVRIDPRNAFSWQKSLDRDYETLGEVRFFENVPDENRSEWDVDTTIRHVTVLRPGEWQDWAMMTARHATLPGQSLASDPLSGAGWAKLSEGVISLEQVPWTTIYADRVDFMVSRPPFLDLAWLNLAHWQSYSDYRHILHIAQVPFLFGSGMKPDDQKITIGMSSATLAEDPNAELRWVEHSGKAIESGRQELIDLEAAMEKLGAALLSSDERPGVQTATAEAIDEAQEKATLGGIVRSLEDGANQFLWYMGQWLGLPDSGEIVIRRPIAMGGQESPTDSDDEQPQQIMERAAA